MSLGTRLRHHADPVLAGVLTTVLVVEILLHEAARPAFAVPAAVVAGIGLAGRRRHPTAAFVLVQAGLALVVSFADNFDNGSLAFIICFLISLYSLGRWTSGREAAVGGALVVAAIVLFGIGDARATDTALSEITLGSIAFAIGFVGGPWAAGLAIRLRLEREAVLDAENRRLEREQEERERRAVTEERSRIARELHDVVSHAISVTVLQARGARRVLDADPDAARDALDAIERTNTAALGDMRRLLAVLRDTEEDAAEHAPQPTLAGLDSLVDRVRASGLPVELDVRGSERDLPPGVDLSAYRIVQEALTNVLKHSADATARVTLEYGDAALAVSVEDDGTPLLNGDSAPGHGLIGIRERVAVVGGEVETGAAPGGGYRVRARLPYSLEVS